MKKNSIFKMLISFVGIIIIISCSMNNHAPNSFDNAPKEETIIEEEDNVKEMNSDLSRSSAFTLNKKTFEDNLAEIYKEIRKNYKIYFRAAFIGNDYYAGVDFRYLRNLFEKTPSVRLYTKSKGIYLTKIWLEKVQFVDAVPSGTNTINIKLKMYFRLKVYRDYKRLSDKTRIDTKAYAYVNIPMTINPHDKIVEFKELKLIRAHVYHYYESIHVKFIKFSGTLVPGLFGIASAQSMSNFFNKKLISSIINKKLAEKSYNLNARFPISFLTDSPYLKLSGVTVQKYQHYGTKAVFKYAMFRFRLTRPEMKSFVVSVQNLFGIKKPIGSKI